MLTHYWEQVDGWKAFSATRRVYDQMLAAMPSDRPSTIVELGTWVGRSTAYLGVEIVNSGKPVTLVAVDHFLGSAEIEHTARSGAVLESEATFRRNLAPVAEALGPRFLLVVEDSALAAELFEDATIDAVWIDASHGYDFVKADIAAWWPKVRPGGLLGGDDWIKCPGVRQAVEERFTAAAGVGTTGWWLVRKGGDGLAEAFT